jgi:catechol 2,3-dioxygenase-like lactoylglutathione lyase family enzyme
MRLRAMLYVRDLPEMAEFYGDLLGLSSIIRTPDYVDFGLLALHAIPREIAENISISWPPKPRETGSTKLIFEVPDPDALRPRLEAAGAQILERPWGDWDAVDLEGNVFALHAPAAGRERDAAIE